MFCNLIYSNIFVNQFSQRACRYPVIVHTLHYNKKETTVVVGTYCHNKFYQDQYQISGIFFSKRQRVEMYIGLCLQVDSSSSSSRSNSERRLSINSFQVFFYEKFFLKYTHKIKAKYTAKNSSKCFWCIIYLS